MLLKQGIFGKAIENGIWFDGTKLGGLSLGKRSTLFITGRSLTWVIEKK